MKLQSKLKDFKYTGKKPYYRITRYLGEDEQVKSIVLPEGIGIIRKNAFHNARLEEIILPEGLECIEENAFLDCKELKRIWIPGSVTKIERDAFKGCLNLEIYLEGQVENGFMNKKEYRWVEEYVDTYVFDFHRGGTSDGGYISIYKEVLSSWNPDKRKVHHHIKREEFEKNSL